MKNLATGEKITDYHGMLVYESGALVGNIFDFKEKGLFDPDGKLDGVTPEQAEEHNRLFDQVIVTGLDENCKVGQGGLFYFDGENKVTTWKGTVIADTVEKTKTTVKFRRKGKAYRGRIRQDEDAVFFKRYE